MGHVRKLCKTLPEGKPLICTVEVPDYHWNTPLNLDYQSSLGFPHLCSFMRGTGGERSEKDTIPGLNHRGKSGGKSGGK